jgi:hypothetical protein
MTIKSMLGSLLRLTFRVVFDAPEPLSSPLTQIIAYPGGIRV